MSTKEERDRQQSNDISEFATLPEGIHNSDMGLLLSMQAGHSGEKSNNVRPQAKKKGTYEIAMIPRSSTGEGVLQSERQ